MPTKLKDLVITKVALVDEGACSAAHIKLFKKKDEGGNAMTFEELMKSLPAEQQAVVTNHLASTLSVAKAATEADLAAKEAELTKVQSDLEDAKKDLADTKAELDKACASKEGEKSEDEIMKGLDPVVRDILEKSRAKERAAIEAINKMKEEKEHEEAIAKAKTMPNIGLEADKFANVIKAVGKLDEEVRNDVMKAFEMANEAISKGGVLNEIGKSAGAQGEAPGDEQQAWAQIEKKAQEIRKSAGGSLENAITRAIQENPDLYKQYLDTQA